MRYRRIIVPDPAAVIPVESAHCVLQFGVLFLTFLQTSLEKLPILFSPLGGAVKLFLPPDDAVKNSAEQSCHGSLTGNAQRLCSPTLASAISAWCQL